MEVLFNADDFGLTKGITDGIIEAHTHGLVTSTTLMMNGRAVEYAVEKAKTLPNLKIGIHLVLTFGKPLLEINELTDQHGNFKFTREMDLEPDKLAVKKEWQAQIDAYLKTGLPLHHIDSHHHVHGWEPLKEVVIDLANKYNVPVRYTETLKNSPDILLTDTLWTNFYEDGVNDQIFTELKELDVRSVEVMTHPSLIDAELQQVSSYVDKRKTELEILTSIKVPDWVELI